MPNEHIMLKVFDNDQLSKSWYAATCPSLFSKRYRKLHIINFDVNKLCDNILEILMEQSENPSKRMSLYVASQLMFGSVFIYQQQVTDLYDKVSIFLNIENIYFKNIRKSFRQPFSEIPDHIYLSPVSKSRYNQNDEEMPLHLSQDINKVTNNEDITMREMPIQEELRCVTISDEGFLDLNRYEQMEFISLFLGSQHLSENPPVIISNNVNYNNSDTIKTPLVSYFGSKRKQKSITNKSKKVCCEEIISDVNYDFPTDKQIHSSVIETEHNQAYDILPPCDRKIPTPWSISAESPVSVKTKNYSTNEQNKIGTSLVENNQDQCPHLQTHGITNSDNEIDECRNFTQGSHNSEFRLNLSPSIFQMTQESLPDLSKSVIPRRRLTSAVNLSNITYFNTDDLCETNLTAKIKKLNKRRYVVFDNIKILSNSVMSKQMKNYSSTMRTMDKIIDPLRIKWNDTQNFKRNNRIMSQSLTKYFNTKLIICEQSKKFSTVDKNLVDSQAEIRDNSNVSNLNQNTTIPNIHIDKNAQVELNIEVSEVIPHKNVPVEVNIEVPEIIPQSSNDFNVNESILRTKVNELFESQEKSKNIFTVEPVEAIINENQSKEQEINEFGRKGVLSNLIRNWAKGMVPLQMKNLTQNAKNKRQQAMVFYTLLDLHKQQIIKLATHEKSSEIYNVEMGEKLKKCLE